MAEYKFGLGDEVELKLRAEKGEIIGRAEYVAAENSYYVRYLNGEGCQVETWIGESSLNPRVIP